MLFVFDNGKDNPNSRKKCEGNASQHCHETLARILPLAKPQLQAAGDHNDSQYKKEKRAVKFVNTHLQAQDLYGYLECFNQPSERHQILANYRSEIFFVPKPYSQQNSGVFPVLTICLQLLKGLKIFDRWQCRSKDRRLLRAINQIAITVST